MNTTELLFAMIRSEISGESKTDVKAQISSDSLSELYRIAKTHDVAHIVSSALYKHGILGDDETSRKFNYSQMVAIYRYEKLKYALSEICSVFEKQEIPYILLKGSVLRSFYPQAWMRTSCDIDVLVHKEDLERAVEVLSEKAGYTAKDRVNYHDVSLYSKAGVHLELHFSIEENIANIDRLLSKVWDYSSRENDCGFRYNQTNEYFLFHHIAHMSYHFIKGGCGIKPFIDLYIMQNQMTYDDSVVRRYCKKCGIEDFYNNVMYLANVWFGDKAHTPLSLKIEEYILKGGVYGSLENKVVVSQSKRGGKIKYALSRIFISYEALKNFYPILKKHKWLFPFMQIRRWFRLIFCNSLGRGIRELKINQRVSKNQASNMSEFLKDVGL